MDFVEIRHREGKRKGSIEVYPEFLVLPSSDLMVRGGDFYAVWDEEHKLWETNEYKIQQLVDNKLDAYANKYFNLGGDTSKFNWDGNNAVDYSMVNVRYMRDFGSNSWSQFKKYLRLIADTHKPLDSTLTFKSTITTKKSYASKRLPYDIEEGPIDAYDELMRTLYRREERDKIEWVIGAIFSGDSKTIQKFMVLYGEAGTGKSTIINIMQALFDGYYTTFDAKALGSGSNQFATEVFRNNPLLAIQHDGDLSRIEDNTKINSIVSHEEIGVNEKYKSSYSMSMNTFLVMGTNRPVKITDSKSGVIRRLIDVQPTGMKVANDRYFALMTQIMGVEIPHIAWYCLSKYRSMGKHYYATYIPESMILATDVFYNFIDAKFHILTSKAEFDLSELFTLYKDYCEEAELEYVMPRHRFREEMKDYFEEYKMMTRVDGVQTRNVYRGFKRTKVTMETQKLPEYRKVHAASLVLEDTESVLDDILADYPAQYANVKETPVSAWDKVTTTLKDIDTSKLHYVRPPIDHIVVDFDLLDDGGNKSMQKNLAAASLWPRTYAELSKGGGGVHLHYRYAGGDPTQLSRIFAEGIEVKVFVGKTSLRRRVSLCNNADIAVLEPGLIPLQEVRTTIDLAATKDEQHLRALIEKALRKDIHPATKPSVDFIHKILEDAYNADMKYDVTDLRQKIITFAAHSTNQATTCLKLVQEMKFRSEDANLKLPYDDTESPIAFYDIEVFPNLFLVCWKYAGPDQKVVRMFNPTPDDVKELFKLRLIGFNNRRYDNHILFARGHLCRTEYELYELSKKYISKGIQDKPFFNDAYNLSYTDVYDFSTTKQSLKQWEVDLGIPHKENAFPWDEPLAKEHWVEVADYCENDVHATEAIFEHNYGEFVAREILAEIAGDGYSPNDTTNSLTAQIIFGNDRKPQSKFVYTDLSTDFPGYTFIRGKSMYRGEEVGEGGYVHAEPGMYSNVTMLDIASMHPTSAEQLNVFGPYTGRLSELKQARLAVKHKDFEGASKLLDGALAKHLTEDRADALDFALKIAINSVYGMTAAKFPNRFKDPKNIDNIVAKRGALFMVDLKHEVMSRGFTVAHIKTDSIKIPNATQEIIDFIFEFGKKYGYEFEHEASYDRMCLVNDAVYIAKYDKLGIRTKGGRKAGEWEAVGAQFKHPFVFKTLFSGEPIDFKDYAEVRAVKDPATIYLDYNEGLPDVSVYEKELNIRLSTAEKKPKNNPMLADKTDEELIEEIAKGHKYIFVGKVGSFVSVKQGMGGGTALRHSPEKPHTYTAVANTKGYRWMEYESVVSNQMEDRLDLTFYRVLADNAIANIGNFGDFEMFRSSDIFENPINK